MCNSSMLIFQCERQTVYSGRKIVFPVQKNHFSIGVRFQTNTSKCEFRGTLRIITNVHTVKMKQVTK